MIEAENTSARPAKSWLPTKRRIAKVLRNPVLRALVSAQLIAALVVLVRSYGWLQPIELTVYDVLRVAWAQPAPADDVFLVGMTEPDIRRWHYPISDDVLADLLERLASWHPRAIGVDIYRDMPVEPSTGKLEAVLKAHPEIVWVFKLAEGQDGTHPEIPPPAPLVGTDNAALADIAADPGDVVRRGLLYADDGAQSYTGLGMALALKYLAGDRIAPEAAANDDLRLGKTVIPPLDAASGPYIRFDSRGYQTLLDFHGGAEPFPRKSIAETMDGDMSGLTRDRVVIIGDALESVKDFFASPFNVWFNPHRVFGMEIHAHLVDQLIRLALGKSQILAGLPRRDEDLWIWVWAVAGAALGLAIRSTLAAAAASFAGVAAIGGIVYAAFGQNLLLPALPAAMAWLGTAAFTNQLLHAASNRARQRLRRSFEHFLPPAVIAEMVRSEELPKLGGERREISVLFTDVASFTTFSEGVDPERLASILNDYLEGVCAAIFANGGLVNAFLGDGVLAFFGAPQAQPDHADRAVAAAFAIDQFAQSFSAEQRARGLNFLHTRIGIHTGFAFVGNVGSHERLQYTALGDILNTGSRLEGLNKAIGTRICVSGDIARKVSRHRCRPVGAFIVKGRHGATEVHEPINPDRYSPEWVERYEAIYHALEADDPGAAALLAALHGDDGDDPCVTFHIRRLAAGETGVLTEMHEK
jgi:adenylate cyclase